MRESNNTGNDYTGISPMLNGTLTPKKVRPNIDLSLWEKLYIIEVVRGLYITSRHFVIHLFGFIFPPAGKKRSIPTVYYPEEKVTLPEAYRGRPLLVMKEDKTEKCVACGLCEKICPGKAIAISPREKENGDRFPFKFVIDMSRCIFCGFCEEVCPKEAIVMSKEYESLATYNRENMIYNKEMLLRPEKELKARIDYVRRIYSKCNQ